MVPFLFVVAFGCLVAHSQNTNRGTNYETAPPVRGSIPWEESQRVARERQEIFRKRIPIPGATADNVPYERGAYSIGNHAVGNHDIASARPATAPLSSSPGTFQKTFFYLVVFLAVGILTFRKFAPEDFTRFNRRFNPLAAGAELEQGVVPEVRSEQESFTRFATAFRVGPGSAGPQTEGLPDEFYAEAATAVAAQRILLEKFKRESDVRLQRKILEDLRLELDALKDRANVPPALLLWQTASALEGLLKQMVEKAGNITASSFRTVVGGVDLLGKLCSAEVKLPPLADQPLKFLVVDDDLISRHAMSLALNKAFSQPDLAVDGAAALEQARQLAYDVIFLDVMMPGMDGFELCTKIRNSPLNQSTPVVFVTSQNDFDARAQSAISGGNDLLGKPFLVFEITVKSLTLGLQKRLQKPALPSPTAKNMMVLPELNRTVTSSSPSPSVPLTAAGRVFAPAGVEGLTEEFLSCASVCAEPLREMCQSLLQCPDEKIRQNKLADAFLGISALISLNHSGISHPSCQLAVALETLLKKLLQDSKHGTASVLGTVVAAMDLLADLCSPEVKNDLGTVPPVNILVVDDDLIMRRVIVGALQTFFTRPESAESGEAALALVAEKTFDVVFMDITMPGMNGFEACVKIRESALNHSTPVVFVTSLTDFQTHAEMSRIGGNDLMAKPFLTPEINVKALTFALRGRLDQLKAKPSSLVPSESGRVSNT